MRHLHESLSAFSPITSTPSSNNAHLAQLLRKDSTREITHDNGKCIRARARRSSCRHHLPSGCRPRLPSAADRRQRSAARVGSRVRSWSGWRPRVCATPTSMPPTVTGRSSRRRRSSLGTRASASWSELGPGVTEVTIGDRVAMPWLGYACGTCDYCVSGWETLCPSRRTWATPSTAASPSTPSPTPATSSWCPTGVDPFDAAPLTLRRRHDLQGRQGGRHALVRPRRGLRSRRARPPGDPVRADRRRQRRRGRPIDEKLELARSSAPSTRSTRPTRTRSPRSRSSAAPTRRSRWLSHRRSFEQAFGSLEARRHARLRRASGGQRDRAADLRDRAQGNHGRRLDRRHPDRPARGVRAARRGRRPSPARPGRSTRSTRRSPTSRPAASSRGSSSSRERQPAGRASRSSRSARRCRACRKRRSQVG